jgi:hypothetical protein
MSMHQDGLEQWGGGQMLKRIGLLACAMLAGVALLAASASSASAAPVGLFLAGEKSEEKAKQPRFEAESYKANVGGSATGLNQFVFSGGKLNCSTVIISGEIASATAELPVFQSFFTCTFGGVFSPSIFQNGCKFVWHVENAGPPYTGSIDIKCPTEKGIEIVASSGGEKYCTVTIPPQTGLKGMSLANAGTGSGRTIAATFNVTGIKYSQVAYLEGGKCTTGAFENGTYTGGVTLSASK